MEMDTLNSNYRLYSNIKSTKIDWLWYPYIPFGKITLIQGDPGCGKSTLMMDIIGNITSGRSYKEGISRPVMNVIYQCSEDGLADTIKPRLEKVGADCSHIGYIYEDLFGLSLDDEKIRNAIVDMDAKLLVIDPFQAYLGDADLSNVISMRRVLRRLSMWATSTNCAIVLIGHLNKKSRTNDLYRGLGSIDVTAAARSVLQVNYDSYNPSIRVIKHIKSSLAPKGNDSFFSINDQGKIEWIDACEIQNNNLDEEEIIDCIQTKQEKAAELLREVLKNGQKEAGVVECVLKDAGISERTYRTVKKLMLIESKKKDGVWYWSLPSNGDNHGEEI